MIGKTLSHFKILAKIGEGGMGVVYRAEDEKLRRPVALKVLPPDLVANEERRLRFLREARTAAAINHPNIATIHEVDEADDVVFIAMELVEGKTLREVMGGKPMPIKDALRVATEMSEGLAEAHGEHVIHRDLKPENVIVKRNGQVKILDFGLAKVIEERDQIRRSQLSKIETISEELTLQGKIFGTTAYMSPEQARGQTIDTRSDLFSFGTTLYEMVTGKVPFQGKTATDTLSSIIRDEPTPPSQLNDTVPQELDRIVGRCLEKDPGERYQDTRDLVVVLRQLKRATDSGVQAVRTPTGPVGVAPVRRSAAVRWAKRHPYLAAALGIALVVATVGTWRATRTPSGFKAGDRLLVADFENDTSMPQFEGAVRDSFEQMLAKSRFIDVVRGRRRSALIEKRVSGSFSRLNRDLADAICREANLSGFITGNIVRQDSGYRVEIKLFRTGAGRPAVSLSEEADSERDILRGLHLLGLAVRKTLGEGPQGIAGTMPPTTESLPAYQAFAMAELLEIELTTGAEAELTAVLKRAIEIDPDFVEAYRELGVNYWNNGNYGAWRSMLEEAYRRAERLPEQARLWYEIEWLDATYDYETEIERLNAYRKLFPSDADAPNYLSVFYGSIIDEDYAAAEGPARDAFALLPDATNLGVLVRRFA
jgi:predicted Ser/Thr protein kinase